MHRLVLVETFVVTAVILSDEGTKGAVAASRLTTYVGTAGGTFARGVTVGGWVGAHDVNAAGTIVGVR